MCLVSWKKIGVDSKTNEGENKSHMKWELITRSELQLNLAAESVRMIKVIQ